MSNVVRKWKRVMAVGCSHGDLIDPIARKAVLKFRRNFKPDKMIHLGDFIDTAAFRTGARPNSGDSDEATPILPDIDAGLDFLKELEVNVVCLGNHEDRLWKLAKHYNAIISTCSLNIIERIETRIALLRAELRPWDIDYGWYKLGNYGFGHGYFYGEQFLRDSAESFGNCVVAHAHRAGMTTGRRLDHTKAFCVGLLGEIKRMNYAKARRSTLAWSGGFVYGEYSDDKTVLWLHDQERNTEEWRTPPV